MVEYESPSFLLFRGGRREDVPKTRIPVERDDEIDNSALWISEFKIQRGDRIVFFSDGVSQSGMGTAGMPFGWGDGVVDFISELIRESPEISAGELSERIVARSARNDAGSLKDDTSCCVIYMRRPRNLLICTGPPFDEKNDGHLSRRVMGFRGRKIICGGTTAQIISREAGIPITMDISSGSKDLPPESTMNGIDLVTEGILTLSKVERLLSEGGTHTGNSPAEKILRLLSDSDKISFLVGTRINIAHQDPTLPVELEMRRGVIKKTGSLLETKWLKDIDITYI
jgi:hypothetical protein